MAFVNQDQRISVVINSFNYAPFLYSALKSALFQPEKCEVIVVDDGSTDDSEQIFLRAEQSGCQVIRKPNGGQASAFNAGFAACQGDWILFLDADDTLLPNAIEELTKAIRPGLSKVHYPLQVIDESGKPTGAILEGAGLSEGDVVDEIARTGHHSWPPTSGNLFSRTFLESIFPMPEDEYRISADLYLNSKAPFFGPIASIPTPLACYRRHGKNLFASNRQAPKARISDAILKLRAYEITKTGLESHDLPNAVRKLDTRFLAMSQLLVLRFAPESGLVKCNRFSIIRRFLSSESCKSAKPESKLRWFALIFAIAYSPPTLVWKIANLRENS